MNLFRIYRDNGLDGFIRILFLQNLYLIQLLRVEDIKVSVVCGYENW